jgi:hypothetical protein
MLAGPALLGQMLAQEAAEMGSERGHTAPPMSASQASAIWSMRTGVACKYQ